MKQKIRSTPHSYELKECLGEGLNSIVYRAVRSDSQRHMQQTVALKILKSKKLVDIWKSEFESLARINSPFCVKVFGFDWINGLPTLILEHVPGVSLRNLCLAGPVPRNVAETILAQIQEGLDELSAQGLCHGDLSPNNVMINTLGQIKLLDFGFANYRDAFVQVTPGFTSPEVLEGQPPTPKSDLYSLGAIEQMLLKSPTLRLHPNPELRPRFEAKELAKETLARRVTDLMSHQNNLKHLKTRPLSATSAASPARRALWVGAALLMLFAPYAEKTRTQRPAVALLKVRSQHWLRVKLNNAEFGFAPQDLVVTAGKNKLQWQSRRASGEIEIVANPGEIRTIRETDL